jgi:hypothetical protein
VMYGNVTGLSILSFTEWQVPFHEKKNKKGEIIENIVFRYKQQNDGVKQ